jgi:diguanylate cyclase (GGDEF)-like protein
MSAAEETAVGRVTPTQIQELMQLHLDVCSRAARAGDEILGRFVRELRKILGVEVAIAEEHRNGWMLRGEGTPPSPAPPDGQEIFVRVAAERGVMHAALWASEGRVWTVAGVGARPGAVLLLQGDWTRSVGALSLLAGDLALLWSLCTTTAQSRSRLLVHRLARSVAWPAKMDALGEVIITSMARAVNASIGSLAAPVETGAELSIIATYGYRRELVEHLRLRPGAGILGSVFQSGRLMLVQSGDEFAHSPGRARYRTKSFVVVPILLGRQAIAVASVTDRRDGAAFTRADASLLRALAAPSALALSRLMALAQAEKFAQSAAIDPGSGAFNRRHLQTRIDEELQRSRRHGAPVSLLMLDLDNFKSINDSFGHLAGDAVIKDVAQILRRSVRIFDVPARFGGEEFAILMPGASVDSATKIAARIRERIEAYRSGDPRLSALRVTASLGLAVSFPDISSQDLVARADDALYLAKRQGKNRLCVLGPDVSASRTAAHRT